MKNLKTKILNAFRNNSEMDNVIDNISYYQKDLAKNITNPLFDKESKNQMLKISADLNSLRKVLQRYENAKQNNNSKAAEEEKENAKNILLKGYISNVKYIWRSEFGEKTCDECASMDGQEFDSVDEIPASPHPNCKCYIEIVENDYIYIYSYIFFLHNIKMV
mgnify:CR=1 FL=1